MDYRHEYKYLCGPSELALERERLKLLLQPDPHAGPNGAYDIRSVYFDDPENRCFRENEDGVDPRAKFRMRIYNGSDAVIRLEKKSKLRGMTRKEAVSLSRAQAETLLAGQLPAPAPERPLLNRMLTELRLGALRPVVIVQYRRTPFVLQVGNVRITLDEAISSSQEIDRFFAADLALRPVLPDGQGVLEVKWDEFLPSWLHDALGLESLRWSGFSKYYLCRAYNIEGGILR